MPTINKILRVNVDPQKNPAAFLSQLNLVLSQVMQTLDEVKGFRSTVTVYQAVDLQGNIIRFNGTDYIRFRSRPRTTAGRQRGLSKPHRWRSLSSGTESASSDARSPGSGQEEKKRAEVRPAVGVREGIAGAGGRDQVGAAPSAAASGFPERLSPASRSCWSIVSCAFCTMLSRVMPRKCFGCP